MALAIVAVISFQEVLFLNEQSRLIDSRIEATATVLLSSDLSLEDLNDVEEATYLIEELIGGESFNQFLILKDDKGREIYRSPGRAALPAVIESRERWQTLETDRYQIRVLTVPVGRRVLQAGLIRDISLMRWRTVTRGLIVFAAGAVLATLVLAFLLSRLIWTPVSRVSEQIERLIHRTQSPLKSQPPEEIPKSLLRLAIQRDEFGVLVQRLIDLHKAIDSQGRELATWTAKVVHELKTPLTVLGTRLSALETTVPGPKHEALLKSAWSEIHHLSDIVNRYLVWARLSSVDAIADPKHALRLGPALSSVYGRLNGFSGQASGLGLEVDGDTSRVHIFTNPSHFDELMFNLVANAQKHGQGPVTIRATSTRVLVVDRGHGPSPEVLRRLGEPFNSGPRGGTGLGLAHVKAICQLNGWALVHQVEADGFSIGFDIGPGPDSSLSFV
jgi:signal transduction histidine kinase